METLTLDTVTEGKTVRIIKVQGRSPFKRRLLEMGFLPGENVYVQKFAPLRDPVEYVIKGYHISLRRQEAHDILVEKEVA
jgi:Fe2+ transport system protein FeoA